MAINNKSIEIRDRVYKGDIGAEQALQNKAILAILMRQDAIVASMTATQLERYNNVISDNLDFTSKVREEALSKYEEIRAIKNGN